MLDDESHGCASQPITSPFDGINFLIGLLSMTATRMNHRVTTEEGA